MSMRSPIAPRVGRADSALLVDEEEGVTMGMQNLLAQHRSLHQSLVDDEEVDRGATTRRVLEEAEELKIGGDEQGESEIDMLIAELGVSDSKKPVFSAASEEQKKAAWKEVEEVFEEPMDELPPRKEPAPVQQKAAPMPQKTLKKRQSAIGKYADGVQPSSSAESPKSSVRSSNAGVSKSTTPKQAAAAATAQSAVQYDANADPEHGVIAPRPKTTKEKRRRHKSRSVDPVSLWRGNDEVEEHTADVQSGGGHANEHLLEYAKFIGIDPDIEPDLMWIAQEGLVAPLPDGWSEYTDHQGHQYYYNHNTGVSTWEHPLDAHYRSIVEENRQTSHGGRPIA
mmetsp:Transcript_40300/g.104457  ORF Transcript_40300/g.104457 Transcript_40300/m.104457 type:complete len:339 (-) Transcript_40300:548-1564(-)